MNISCYPLHQLETDLEVPFQIDRGVSVSGNSLDLSQAYRRNLSEEDIHYINHSQFLLSVDERLQKPEKASLIFILACRLLKRTRVFIRYRVDSSDRVHKVRDDYPFDTTQQITKCIKSSEFNKVSKIYVGLKEFSSINRRTGNAGYFLSKAYRSTEWLESLIFHVCALETLTSSSQYEKSVTEKFTSRIHNFIEFDEDKLKRIYNVRSELVHGRYDHKSGEENLKLYRAAEMASRKTFYKLVTHSDYVDAFKNETTRMNLFCEKTKTRGQALTRDNRTA